MNTDSGMTRKEARIAELDRIIQTEEAKPDPDYQLIDDCIREIGELEGAKVDFSKEEVAETTKKILRKAEREKRRKRVMRYAAAAAAVVMLAGGVTACTVNPALVDWLVKVTRIPFGREINQEGYTYKNLGNTDSFVSIDDLIYMEHMSIYYPMNIQNYVDLVRIVKSTNGESDNYCFFYSDPDYSFTIYKGTSGGLQTREVTAILQSAYGDFYINQQKDMIQAYGIIGESLYSINCPDLEEIIDIVNSLERIS